MILHDMCIYDDYDVQTLAPDLLWRLPVLAFPDLFQSRSWQFWRHWTRSDQLDDSLSRSQVAMSKMKMESQTPRAHFNTENEVCKLQILGYHIVRWTQSKAECEWQRVTASVTADDLCIRVGTRWRPLVVVLGLSWPCLVAGFRGGVLGGAQVRFAGGFETLESELGLSSTLHIMYIYMYGL